MASHQNRESAGTSSMAGSSGVGPRGSGVIAQGVNVGGKSSVGGSVVSDPEAQREMLSKKYRWNWRLNQLSEPAPRLRGKKYEKPPDIIRTNVSPAALKATPTMRTDHLARPALRLLEYNKNNYEFKGEKYVKRMSKKIDESWNSIYNYYRKADRDRENRKKATSVSTKSSKGSIRSRGSKRSKKSKDASEKEREEWVKNMAKPKVRPKPEPVDRGSRIEDLDSIKEHMTVLATPTQIMPKYDPEDEHWKDPRVFKVRSATLTYEPTERIRELAKPTRIYEKPMEEPIVKQSALQYRATETINILAQPKKKATKETDVNEDAFVISKAALTYVATPRILELAKPSER